MPYATCSVANIHVMISCFISNFHYINHTNKHKNGTSAKKHAQTKMLNEQPLVNCSQWHNATEINI